MGSPNFFCHFWLVGHLCLTSKPNNLAFGVASPEPFTKNGALLGRLLRTRCSESIEVSLRQHLPDSTFLIGGR